MAGAILLIFNEIERFKKKGDEHLAQQHLLVLRERGYCHPVLRDEEALSKLFKCHLFSSGYSMIYRNCHTFTTEQTTNLIQEFILGGLIIYYCFTLGPKCVSLRNIGIFIVNLWKVANCTLCQKQVIV